MLKKLSDLYKRGWVCESWWSDEDNLFHCRLEHYGNHPVHGEGIVQLTIFEDGRTLETCLRRGVARALREDGGE